MMPFYLKNAASTGLRFFVGVAENPSTGQAFAIKQPLTKIRKT